MAGVPLALRMLKRWSIERDVPLRIIAHVGTATTVPGADGRKQIVGDGINLCGSLIEVAPTAAILVTAALAEFFSAAPHSDLRFHDPRNVYLKHFRMTRVYLCSIDKEQSSTWGPLHRSDRIMLSDAMKARAPWDVILYSKRIIQMNSGDPDATNAITNSVLGDYGELLPQKKGGGISRSSLFSTIDPPSFLSFVVAADLVERRDGEIICNKDDPGDTMFIVLQGELSLVIAIHEDEDAPAAASKYTQELTFGPGDIVGELAAALRTKRTAALQAIGSVSLLSFSYPSLRRILAAHAQNERVSQALTNFLDLRVLEYICNHADYLVGFDKDRRGPLSNVRHPWESLYAYSRRLDLSAGEQFDSSKPWFAEPGLYVLASGTLAKRTFEMPAAENVEGDALPPILVNFPDRLVSRFPTYKVRSSSATVIRVSEAGLGQWGSSTLEECLTFISRALARTFEYDVFISFGQEDIDLAGEVKSALNALGLTVYLDTVTPGKQFSEQIQGVIASSLVFVAINTPSVVRKQAIGEKTGEKTYMEKEVAFRRLAFTGERNLIPLRVGNSQIVSYLRGISYIDIPLAFDTGFALPIKSIVDEIKEGGILAPCGRFPIERQALAD